MRPPSYFSLIVIAFVVIVAGVVHSQSEVESFPRVMQSEDSAVSSALQKLTDDVGTTPQDMQTLTGIPTLGTPIVWSILQSREASGGSNLCYDFIDIDDDCATSGLTCSAAATDGILLLPEQSVPLKWNPARVRVCVVGSAAATDYHASSEVVR